MENNPLGLIAAFTRSRNLMSRCRYVMFMLALMSLVVVVYCVDAPYPSRSDGFNKMVSSLMLSTSIGGAIGAITLFLQANAGLRAADITWKDMRFIDSPYLPFCVVEVLVWMIHCPPGCEYSVSNPRVLNAFSLLRFYVVVPLFSEISPINQFKARSLAYFSRIRLSASLILRTQLHQSPVLTLSVVYCLFACILGTFFALSEGHTFETSVWFIFVTSTTVGYGDTFPTGAAGRLVAAIATVNGLLLVGFIVGAIQQNLALSDDEKALFNYMELNDTKQTMKDDSAVVLQRYWRLRKNPTPLATWKLSAAMLAFRGHRIQSNLAKRAVEHQQVSDDSDVLCALTKLEAKIDALENSMRHFSK